MSKKAAIDRMKSLVADWIGQAASPEVSEPSPTAPLGSWLLRAQNNIKQIFLKQAAGTGPQTWSLQNYDLRIYNMVADFGAVGDGVTDNRAAINNAIAAADAAGGGVLYFPPGQYAVLKPNAGTADICPISNRHNITFLGDGKASQIRLAGNQFATDTFFFRIHNLSSGIQFLNLFIDSGLATNIEPSNQNHMIEINGAVADGANTPPKDVEVWGCYLGQSFGDQIRFVGDTNEIVTDCRVYYNVMDGRDNGGSRHSRTCCSFQRGVQQVLIEYNWMTGVLNGQLIDMEPSGTATLSDVSIIGNQLDHNSQGSAAVTLGGLPGGNCHHYVVAFNTLQNGGNIAGLLFGDSVIMGNAVLFNSTTNPEGILYFQDYVYRTSFVANVGVITDVTLGRISMSMVATGTAPEEILIADNVLRCANIGVVGNGAGFLDCANASQILCTGNIWTGPNTLANDTGLKYRTGTVGAVWDHITFKGELAVFDAGSAGAILSVCQISASNANSLGNCYVGQNYFRKPTATGVMLEWLESGGAVFNAYRYSGDNLMLGGLSNITFPASNKGVTGLGTAGPGAQIGVSGGTPVGNVSAVAGSMDTNQGGGVATTIFVKETGAGLSGGTGGWIGVGSQELTFGVQDTTATTTTLFLATGIDLATAKATAIEMRLTRAARIRNGRVKQIAGTGTGTISYVVRKNNVAQSGTITINFTATTGGPALNFTGVAGDTISIVITKSQAPTTNPTLVQYTLDLVG